MMEPQGDSTAQGAALEAAPTNTKYVFVSGGVCSSLGKGIIAASLGKLLQSRGYKVSIQKLDPYLNIDPGTLNPYEHGECYVTQDGAETDLDLGHYERFLNHPTSQANSVSSGQVYQSVIQKERRGEYLGKTVQVIPHITDEIKRRIKQLASRGCYDVCIVEIGGTVGDIESLPYIEAIRQLKWDLGPRDTAFVHLTLVPYLAASGELKTKPTQHSVKEMLQNGIQPDIIVLRSEHQLSQDLRAKVAHFCNVKPGHVVQSIDVPTIYEVPLRMHEEGLDTAVLEKLDLPAERQPDLAQWKDFLTRFYHPKHTLKVALVGKYVKLPDAYKSIHEAVIHAGAALETRVELVSISSEELTADNVGDHLHDCQAIIVAPGFGQRGIEGKICAVQYAREQGLPFLGICLGMQCAVVEFARHVLHLDKATSREWDPGTHEPVIDLMESQKDVIEKGGTMRLGAYPCRLSHGSKVYQAYGADLINERHRHRYEFNEDYCQRFAQAGMVATGRNPQTNLVEVVEIPSHPWFVGVQFHPEYQSSVLTPHPLFVALFKAALQQAQSR